METRLWTIEPLCFGEFPVSEKSFQTYFANQGVKHSIPLIGFLLRSNDETILVDTGAGPVETHHFSHSPLRRSPDQVPLTALRAAGVDPETLKTVVLTHLHYDHSYNLELFPNARFIVQAEELRAAVDPIAAQRSTYEFGLEGIVPPWMSVTDQISIVRGDTNLRPGIDLLHLPGHTPGMQGVSVETERGTYVLGSDLVSLYENIGTGNGDWIVPGIHTDVVACERSIERLLAFDAEIVPGHDWEVFERLGVDR